MSLDDDPRAQNRRWADPDYTYPDAWARSRKVPEPAPPRQPPRILVADLLQTPSLKHATNSAHLLSEFVTAQQEKLRQRPKTRRPYSLPPIDSRLWLDGDRDAGWTLCGHLVSIEDRHNLCPFVRPITEDERRQLLAVNRLIDVVIKLYPGDRLDKGKAVTRYMAHHDLEAALQEALARALEEEERITEELSKREARPATKPSWERGPRKRKSRFHPQGNFVLYQPPRIDLFPFAILLPPGVPKAFESRRKAERFITKSVNRAELSEGCQIARVCARAKVRPVFRQGVPIPREVEKLIELIRKEPRVAGPELQVTWLPRYWQDESGEWVSGHFKNKRTVRHGHGTCGGSSARRPR